MARGGSAVESLPAALDDSSQKRVEGDFDLLRGIVRTGRGWRAGSGGATPPLNDTEQIRQSRGKSARHLGRRHTHSSPSQFPTRRDPPPLPFPAAPPTTTTNVLPEAGAALFTSGAAAALQCLSNRPQVDLETNRSEIWMDSADPRWDLITGATVFQVLLRSVPHSARNMAAGPSLSVNRAGPW